MISAGDRFCRLTAVRKIKKHGRPYWICECECGEAAEVYQNHLRTGHTTSCGCRRRDGSIRRTHGMKGTRIYAIWKDMRKRCNNPNSKAYKNYGGRGIRVCKEWDDAGVFYADMGDPPTNKHTLDRIDNDGDYCAENCRWATRKEQMRNNRRNLVMSLNGVSMCASEWAETLGMSVGNISRRKGLGWTDEQTLTTPIGEKPKEEAA